MKKELKKEDIENLSYKDIAYLILDRDKNSINTLDLFTKIILLLELPNTTIENKIGDFYTSLATDKRFILVDGSWDLRKRHTSDKIITIEDDEDEDMEDTREEIEITEDEYTDEFDDSNEVDNNFDDQDDDLADLVILDDDELNEE